MRDLFTVLIAEKPYIDAIRLENKLFFEPFLENKELSFCYWNPQGQNLQDSVPDLIDTVGRKKDWKAIIIHNCTDEQAKQKNPFDIVDSSDLKDLIEPSQNPMADQDWDDWEELWKSYYNLLIANKEEVYKRSLALPLQKLTTWLSFRPADFVLNDTQEKDDIHEWALHELSQGEVNPLVRLERLERDEYRSELKMKEMLRREFVGDNTLGIAYPKEIYCISKRTSENGFFNPEAYWNTRSKNEYSEFCDRNMYFDKMRFLVFDLLPEKHKDFRCDKIRFLSTLLVFATNIVPGSTMEARRLYVLECENDDTPLFTLTTSYDKKLAATYEVIDNEIDRIYGEIPGELTDKVAESLFCSPMNVEVKLDENCDFDALYPEDDFALIPSSPEAEVENWEESYKGVLKSYGNIIRQQRRSVKKGIDKLNLSSELSEANISRLTPFQLDDIGDYTENAENEMVASLPPDLAEASKYEEMMREKADKVKDVLEKRMSKTAAIVVSAIILLMTLMLYAPFIVSNLSSSETIATSLGMLGVILAILAVALVITLIVLKLPLREAVKDFQSTMHSVVDEINDGMRRFSRYFSLTANVRRGYKIKRYAAKNLDEYTKSIRIRRKHQEDIRKKRAELEEMYPEFIGDSKYYENTMIQPYDYDFDKKVEYEYAAPFLAGFCRNIDFLEKGNHVEVPSGYITDISVRMEEIYDK
ncbi:MAG: hypothetical protein IKI97_14380 [Clostridia bacterium]|nr:hypothetical protein [Clostridia bacterium]